MVMMNETTAVYPRKLRRLCWPFLALAEGCREIVGTVAGSFEIITETPAAAPMTRQVEAISCALHAVLTEYRGFIAQGANL